MSNIATWMSGFASCLSPFMISCNVHANDFSDDTWLVRSTAYYQSRIAKEPCEQPDLEFPRWRGFPVTRCPYSEGEITVKTYMLNPTAERLAKWTVTACHDAAVSDLEKCFQVLQQEIVDASSGVFPVAGFIPEPAKSGGGNGSGIVCFLFRDGVTVTTKLWTSAGKPKGKTCADGKDFKDDLVTNALMKARVASTKREELRDALPMLSGEEKTLASGDTTGVLWLDVVAQLYQHAWNSDRNVLITAKAIAMKRAGVLH